MTALSNTSISVSSTGGRVDCRIILPFCGKSLVSGRSRGGPASGSVTLVGSGGGGSGGASGAAASASGGGKDPTSPAGGGAPAAGGGMAGAGALASCAQAGQAAPINPTDAACPRKRLREERLTDIERDSQPLADIGSTVADRLLPNKHGIRPCHEGSVG